MICTTAFLAIIYQEPLVFSTMPEAHGRPVPLYDSLSEPSIRLVSIQQAAEWCSRKCVLLSPKRQALDGLSSLDHFIWGEWIILLLK